MFGVKDKLQDPRYYFFFFLFLLQHDIVWLRLRLHQPNRIDSVAVLPTFRISTARYPVFWSSGPEFPEHRLSGYSGWNLFCLNSHKIKIERGWYFILITFDLYQCLSQPIFFRYQLWITYPEISRQPGQTTSAPSFHELCKFSKGTLLLV